MDTYEQKYKEVLKRAKQIHHFSSDIAEIKRMEELFPELKESSEDEKIRKALLKMIQDIPNNLIWVDYGISKKDAITWFEKQGEQKSIDPDIIIQQRVDALADIIAEQTPVNKVKPKFHKGDWVIHQGTENIYQVVAVIDNQYQLKYGDNYTIQNCVDVDKCARLYDVSKDAKKGDVLSDGTTIFIFKDLLSDGSVMSCCDYDTDSGDSDAFCPFSTNLMCSKITPATKEQCDLIFSKMKESDYDLDSETKELIKVPKLKKPTGVLKELIDDDKNHIDSLLKRLTGLCRNEFERTRFAISEDQDWLESLKERLS